MCELRGPSEPQPGRRWRDWVARHAVSRCLSQKTNSGLRVIDTNLPLQLSTTAQARAASGEGRQWKWGQGPTHMGKQFGSGRQTHKGMSSWSCYMATQSSSGPPILSNQTLPGLPWPVLAQLFPKWARAFVFCLHTCFAIGPALKTASPVALSQGQAIATPCSA